MSETIAAKRQVTREEYQAIPEGPPHYELIRGELVEMTRPLRAHHRVFLKLARLLGSYVEDELGAELAPEPNLYLPGIEDVYHPDLVYVALENQSISRQDGIHGTPDMICEILSPTTRRKDRFVKLEDFCRAGVPH
ncbi:MAG TPA: Uma2 family endonuclease, partial [Armatimonadota bacterium]|nr:Uma2 family endonuclease [Armatimonadota bacterium]